MSAADSLPDDVATLKRLVLARDAERARARAEASSADALIAHLRLAIEKMRRELYGQRSERKAHLLDQMELKLEELEADAAEAVYHAITSVQDDRRKRMRVILRRADPVGHTGDVRFVTRKPHVETTLSEVSHVVLDGPGGNTWEEKVAQLCEDGWLPDVAAYVKNDHLGFSIPYVHKGRTHAYVPDFLLRLKRRDGESFDRVLIVEVSGGMKAAHSPGSVAAKATTARDSWCAGVNNHGGFGRWGYIEVSDISTALKSLRDAISALYADAPIIGDPDLLDYTEVNRGS